MSPRWTPDPEYPEDPAQNGTRRDGRDLVAEWLSTREVAQRGCSAGHGVCATATTVPSLPGCALRLDKKGLDAVDDTSVSHLMGKSVAGFMSAMPPHSGWHVAAPAPFPQASLSPRT